MAESGTTDAQSFRLMTSEDGERATVALHGELDLGTADAVAYEVGELRERGAHAVVLDLRALAFIDSSGLRLLLQLDADARERGLDFSIVEGDGPVRRLLELTNLSGDFRHAEL